MARTNKYTSLNFNDIYEKKIINPNNNNTTTSNNSNSKSTSSLSSSNKSYSLSASSRIHGNMLVLSRPSPKPQPPKQQQHQQQLPLSQSPNQQPLTQPIRLIQQSQSQSLSKLCESSDSVTPQPQPQPQPQFQQSSVVSAGGAKSEGSISLRPKGNTGGSMSFHERETKVDGGSNNINNSNSNYHSINSSNKFVPPHLRPGYVPKAVPEFQKPGRQGNHRPVSAHGIFHGSPNRFVDDGRPKSGGGYDRRMRGPGFGPGHGPAEADLVRPRSGGNRPSSSG